MTPIRKILMTADTVGGVWTYAVDLCRALAPHDVNVTLAAMGAPLSADQRRTIDRLPNVQVHESVFKLEWMDEPWEDVRRSGEWLLEIEQDFEPDIVHLNGYAHGSLPWSAPVVVVGHSCVSSWWQAVKGASAPAEWDHYRHVVRDGLRDADLVVAPSAAMLAALKRHYGPLERTRVIHNGRDASIYREAPKEPFVLCAGRLWDEAKNLATLEKAASGLTWPVWVAGDNRPPDALGAARPDAPPLQSLGKLGEANLADWLARAAIYALPARYEPFGLSALEASLSGCALVLGDIDSLQEIWGDAAEFVPPNDAEALRKALQRLINMPARRAELARRATERSRHYTAEKMAEQYLAAYREQRRVEMCV